MSQFGKLSLLIGFCIFLIGSALRILLGLGDVSWAVWAPVFVLMLGVLATLIKDRKFFIEFLTLKTTRHGTHMGTAILGVLIFLIAINFISFSRNKKWDLTDEKLNSLSEQSAQILKGLDSEFKMVGFFLENVPEQNAAKEQFLQLTEMMRDESSFVKLETVNPQKRPDLVKRYGVELPGVVVLLYKGKQNTISEISEENLINGIIKISRGEAKVIYALSGHGEVDLDESGPLGGSSFKKGLEESNYEIRELNLVQTPKVPEDASILMILGPRQALFKSEVDLIRGYLKNGGRLFVAADPGQKHEISQVTQLVGIQFEDNYIIDSVGQLVGASAALAVGVLYSSTSPITKGFQNQMSGFQLASVLSTIANNTSFQVEELVQSSPSSFSKKRIESSVSYNSREEKKGPFAIGMSSEGSFEGSEKPSAATIFGDSDFLTNQFLLQLPMNRDLALNSVSFLTQEKDLISIRPKAPKGSNFILTQTQFLVLLFGVLLPVPILSLISSIVLWYKRRHA